MKKIFPGLLAVAMAGLLQSLWLSLSAAEVVDRIVAEVNDEIITMSELQQASKSIEAQAGVKPKGKEEKEIQRQMLEALIDRKLAKAEAKRRGIVVEDKELEAAVANFKKKNHLENEEAFNKALNQAGMSAKELRQTIADQMIQERLVTVAVGAKTTVSEAEVRRIYDGAYKEGGSGTQMHLRVIKMSFTPGMTDAQKEELKKKAETVVMEVKNGASFPEVASKYSLAESDIGFVSANDLEPRLAAFLSKLKPKEVAPALTPEGIQLIQMVERRSGGQAKSFEEAAPEIRFALKQKEMQKNFSVWVKTLREKAHIKIML